MTERRKLYSFWMDPETAARLKRRKARTGQRESDQIRAAITAWLDRMDARRRRARKEGRRIKRQS